MKFRLILVFQLFLTCFTMSQEKFTVDGVEKKFIATRYHSLVALKSDFPNDLIVTSSTNSDLIMSLEHKKLPIFGVQFHPESILTEPGMKIVKNFLEIAYSNA